MTTDVAEPSAETLGSVRNTQEEEALLFEFGQQRRDRLVDMELLHRQGADLVLALDRNPVQYPVPLKKYALLHTGVKA